MTDIADTSHTPIPPPTVRLFTSKLAPANYTLVLKAFLTEVLKRLGILEKKVINVKQGVQPWVKREI